MIRTVLGSALYGAIVGLLVDVVASLIFYQEFRWPRPAVVLILMTYFVAQTVYRRDWNSEKRRA